MKERGGEDLAPTRLPSVPYRTIQMNSAESALPKIAAEGSCFQKPQKAIPPKIIPKIPHTATVSGFIPSPPR